MPPERHLHAMRLDNFKGTRFPGDPVSPNAVCCSDLPGASVNDLVAFGPKAHRPPELNSLPCPHAPQDSICMTRALETLVGLGESPASKFHHMPSVATTYRAHGSMIQLLLAQRLTGPQAQFFTMPTCPRDGICMALSPGTLGEPGKSPAIKFHQLRLLP